MDTASSKGARPIILFFSISLIYVFLVANLNEFGLNSKELLKFVENLHHDLQF